MKVFGRYRKDTNGAAAIEFALILPILVVVLMGLVNFGFILIKSDKLNGVLSSGILYSVHTPSDLTATIDKMKAASNLNPIDIKAEQVCECPGGVEISCSNVCSGSVTPTHFITFTANSSVATLPVLLPIISNPYPITGSVTFRIN